MQIILIFIVAWYIQTHSVLNWDVSYLMHASSRLMEGGNYLQNFFETNPPMILFLYTIPVLLVKKLFLRFDVALRIFVFSLSFLSLTLCGYFFKKNYQKNVFFISVLAIIFCLLPTYEFGQREHLLILLIMPYVIATDLRLRKQRIPNMLALVIGFMAGCGFALKPFFVIPLILSEVYLVFLNKKLFAWVRVESMMLLAVLIGYLILIVSITPEYITESLPHIVALYYPGFARNILDLTLKLTFCYCILAVICFFSINQREKDGYINAILVLYLCGFMLVYVLEGTAWYYHIIPAFSFACLLLSLLFANFLTRNIEWKYTSQLLSAFLILFIIFCQPIIFIYNWSVAAIDDKKNGIRNELLSYMKSQGENHTCYFLSTSGFEFPMVDEAKWISVSRFPSYWWLPGIINLKKQIKTPAAHSKILAEENYFVSKVVEDLTKYKPQYVFVDIKKINPQLVHNINYLNYFSNFSGFRQIWKHYRYETSLNDLAIYKQI